MGIIDPDGDLVTFTSVTTASGSAVLAADKKSFTYTPAANAIPAGKDSLESTATLVLSDGGNAVTVTVPLVIKNQAPTGRNLIASVASTESYSASLTTTAATDKDGDSVLFAGVRLETGFPGKVVLAADKKSFSYIPIANYYSGDKVILWYTLSDAKNTSVEFKVTLTITGSGTLIVQGATFPANGNSPPTAVDISAATPWTESFTVDLAKVYASDLDGGTLSFAQVYVEDGFPGTVSIAADKASFIYVPLAGYYSGAMVPVWYTVSDGTDSSQPRKLLLNLTGVGTAIVKGMQFSSIRSLGQLGAGLSLQQQGVHTVSLQLPSSSPMSLDLYDLRGTHLGQLLQGSFPAGVYQAQLPSLGQGVYIVRLRQAGQAQSLRIDIR